MFLLCTGMAADSRVRVVFQFRDKHQHCEVRCGGCGRRVVLPPLLAIRCFGALTDVAALERRLRCTTCGAKRARVTGVWREYHG